MILSRFVVILVLSSCNAVRDEVYEVHLGAGDSRGDIRYRHWKHKENPDEGHVKDDKDPKGHDKEGKANETEGKEEHHNTTQASQDHHNTTEADQAVGGKDAFKDAAENTKKIDEKVGEVKAATDHAQEKSKEVDKDFSKYDSQLKKLDEMLDKVSQKSFRWQKEIMNGLAESEGEKYSPLANAEGILRHGQRNMTGTNSTSPDKANHSL
mmetsp:Transcript_3912/g.6414  ORF Transcript_3912/g.6414 Transcript_3912/m.6414 type:complete len:210 (+) Transcript_3912:119-748(+)